MFSNTKLAATLVTATLSTLLISSGANAEAMAKSNQFCGLEHSTWNNFVRTMAGPIHTVAISTMSRPLTASTSMP